MGWLGVRGGALIPVLAVSGLLLILGSLGLLPRPGPLHPAGPVLAAVLAVLLLLLARPRQGVERECISIYLARGSQPVDAAGEAVKLAERMASCSKRARITYDYKGRGPAKLCVEGGAAAGILQELSTVIGAKLVATPPPSQAAPRPGERRGSTGPCSVWVPGPATAARITRIIVTHHGDVVVADWKGILRSEDLGCSGACRYVDLSFTISIPRRLKELEKIRGSHRDSLLVLIDPVELEPEQIKRLGGVIVVTTDYQQASSLTPCPWSRIHGTVKNGDR